jgi:hypothetical protein
MRTFVRAATASLFWLSPPSNFSPARTTIISNFSTEWTGLQYEFEHDEIGVDVDVTIPSLNAIDLIALDRFVHPLCLVNVVTCGGLSVQITASQSFVRVMIEVIFPLCCYVD